MIAELNRQLAEKKTEVEQLWDELTRMGSEVETLAETVAERTAEVEDLSGEKLELENRLHTVYYIVGAEKELRDAQIVNKQGFIGRTLTVGQHGSMESFTQADSRLLSEIPVGHRKVTVVSTHPEGSYELVTDGSKSVEKLLITDPVRFWESSKVLVVSYTAGTRPNSRPDHRRSRTTTEVPGRNRHTAGRIAGIRRCPFRFFLYFCTMKLRKECNLLKMSVG